MTMIDKLGGRKFILSAATGIFIAISGTLFVLTGKLDALQFFGLIIANAFQFGLTNAAATTQAPVPAPTPPASVIVNTSTSNIPPSTTSTQVRQGEADSLSPEVLGTQP